MLPACRTAGEGFAIPTFDLTPPDVEGLLEELWEFQSNFHDGFPRSETRAHFFLWHLQIRLEKKSTSAYGLAGPAVIGGGLTPQSLPCG